MPEEEQERRVTTPLCSGGKRTKSIEILRELTDGQNNFADTWTTSRRSTSPDTAPWHQRHGYETPSCWYAMMMIAKLDRCEREKDFKSTTQTLTSLRQEQGRQNSKIPKNERVRQRPFDEALRADLEWQCPNWKNLTGRKLPLHHLHNNGGNTNTKNTRTPRHSMARSQLVERVMATDSFKAT